jgi:6-phosphogluconate dehydrogenase (decarboxylating)
LLEGKGIHFVDVGVSGGIWGLDEGFCLMIGGLGRSVAIWIRCSSPLPRREGISIVVVQERGISSK